MDELNVCDQCMREHKEITAEGPLEECGDKQKHTSEIMYKWLSCMCNMSQLHTNVCCKCSPNSGAVYVSEFLHDTKYMSGQLSLYAHC